MGRREARQQHAAGSGHRARQIERDIAAQRQRTVQPAALPSPRESAHESCLPRLTWWQTNWFGGRVSGYSGIVPDRIAEPWGARTPYAAGHRWPDRVDSYLAERLEPGDVDYWVPSAAVLHSNGDGLDIAVKDGRIVGVRGRQADRVNHGRVDPKDLFGWQANNHADVVALFGHNAAETQTVLWTRMLDRLAGDTPPRIICVDPRSTPVARAAAVHLAPTPGTNVALMNALLCTSWKWCAWPRAVRCACCGSAPPTPRCRCPNCAASEAF
jgi:hypothetical protein